MKSEAIILLKVWSIIFTTLFYSFFIVSKIPKGFLRLFSIIPLLFLYIYLPLHLTTVLPAGVTAFFVTWLTSSKLLLFAFNLGPLTRPVSGLGSGPGSEESDVRNLRETITPLSKFIATAAFPIKGNDENTPRNKPVKIIPLSLFSETLISSVLIAICDRYKQELHTGVIFVIHCFLLYFLVDIIVGLANKLVGPIADVELAQPSDEPYLSTSLQDFWGKRWNLMVTDTLRQTVYLPTRVLLSNYVGKEWALAGGFIGSFLVSGLMHELIFYYMTRVRPSWEVTWFFLLHGVCVVVEVGLKKVLGPRFKLHWAVSGLLTIGFVMGTGSLWFFPPLVRNNVDVRATEEFKTLFGFLKGRF